VQVRTHRPILILFDQQMEGSLPRVSSLKKREEGVTGSDWFGVSYRMVDVGDGSVGLTVGFSSVGPLYMVKRQELTTSPNVESFSGNSNGNNFVL
jgi:hypothetical protein